MNAMEKAVKSIEAFLASSEVVLRADRFCPFKDFKDMWMAFSRANGYSHHNKPVTADMFAAPFEKYGLRIEADVREYRGNLRKGQWVVGADLADADGAAPPTEPTQPATAAPADLGWLGPDPSDADIARAVLQILPGSGISVDDTHAFLRRAVVDPSLVVHAVVLAHHYGKGDGDAVRSWVRLTLQ